VLINFAGQKMADQKSMPQALSVCEKKNKHQILYKAFEKWQTQYNSKHLRGCVVTLKQAFHRPVVLSRCCGVIFVDSTNEPEKIS